MDRRFCERVERVRERQRAPSVGRNAWCERVAPSLEIGAHTRSRGWRYFETQRIPPAWGQFGAIQGAAPSFGVEIIPIAVDDAETIERGITAFARTPNGGLIRGGIADDDDAS